jgi:hypothetical protein
MLPVLGLGSQCAPAFCVHRQAAAPRQRIPQQLAADRRGRPAEPGRDRPQAEPLGLQRGQLLPLLSVNAFRPTSPHPGLPFMTRALLQRPEMLGFTPDSADLRDSRCWPTAITTAEATVVELRQVDRGPRERAR